MLSDEFEELFRKIEGEEEQYFEEEDTDDRGLPPLPPLEGEDGEEAWDEENFDYEYQNQYQVGEEYEEDDDTSYPSYGEEEWAEEEGVYDDDYEYEQ